jgi:hypothetical protein
MHASRAGNFVWGVNGSNACPAGSSVITGRYSTDYDQCQAAAAAAGKVFAGNGDWSAYPRGCIWSAFYGNVVLNTHPTGAAYPGDIPLCALPTTGT